MLNIMNKYKYYLYFWIKDGMVWCDIPGKIRVFSHELIFNERDK